MSMKLLRIIKSTALCYGTIRILSFDYKNVFSRWVISSLISFITNFRIYSIQLKWIACSLLNLSLISLILSTIKW